MTIPIHELLKQAKQDIERLKDQLEMYRRLDAHREENVSEILTAFTDLEPCGHAKNFLIGDDYGHFTCTVCEIDRLRAKLNTPELHDFAAGVVSEAQHQRHRWGVEHDGGGKAPQDWFWLIGYLAGKALAAHIAGNDDKALHHTISTAAALANWHSAISGANTDMRPGIEPPTAGPSTPKE
jgi:hypothetical protein